MSQPLFKGIKLAPFIECLHCHALSQHGTPECKFCNTKLSTTEDANVHILAVNLGARYTPFVECPNCRKLVSANGVEGYRQKTPANIVEITELLLKSGAEVDAEADVYGGGSTTLGLVATSVHPFRAGVQNPLLQLLLDYGAEIDHKTGAGNRARFSEHLRMAARRLPRILQNAVLV